MRTKYTFREQYLHYFVTFAFVNRIDLLTRNMQYKKIMLESWKYCQENKGLDIFGCAAFGVVTNSYLHKI